jgi:hypothetical protein
LRTVRSDFLVRRIPDDAYRLGKFGGSEEAGLTLAHAQTEFAIDAAIEVKEEEADIAEVGVFIDVDVVLELVAHSRERTEEGQLATEHPVDALAAVEEVDAEPGDEEEVGLSGFDQNSGADALFMDEPGIGADRGFGPDRAGLHGGGLATDAGDAIGQQKRWLRHADLMAVGILRREQGSKEKGDLSRCVKLKVVAGELALDGLFDLRRSRGKGPFDRDCALCDGQTCGGGLAHGVDVSHEGAAVGVCDSAEDRGERGLMPGGAVRRNTFGDVCDDAGHRFGPDRLFDNSGERGRGLEDLRGQGTLGQVEGGRMAGDCESSA